MTREEAITVLEGLSDNPLLGNQHKAAFNIAIHDIKQRHDWDINNLILINKDNYEPLGQEPCEDCVSREEALEALEKEEPLVWCDGADELAAHDQWSSDVDTIKNIPSVQPKYNANEWCHDCSEYDQEKHCCPRYNGVIRKAVEEIKQQTCENVAVTHKNLCDSCTIQGCIFQSGIVRNHCDFYKAESEET